MILCECDHPLSSHSEKGSRHCCRVGCTCAGFEPLPAFDTKLHELLYVIRDINTSVAFDCMQHETLTANAKRVLRDAPELLRTVLAERKQERVG